MKEVSRPKPENLFPFPRKTPVSVMIPVKNEEKNLGPCLYRLHWADEIFVVDSQSTDGTSRIASATGAKVIQFFFNGSYPKKKNWALENLPFRNEWVLIVDADEWIPTELVDEIHEAVTGRKEYDGYYINRRFFFLGRWIRHCGYYPSYNLRLFKHRMGRYEVIPSAQAGDNEVHEHVLLQGRSGFLTRDMLHHAYPDILTWVEKHNRYSSWEAEVEGKRMGPAAGESGWAEPLRWKRRLKRLYLRLPMRFVFRFFYAYLWKSGFRDGKAGFIFCILLSFYDFLSWAKSWERKHMPSPTKDPISAEVQWDERRKIS